MVRLTVIYIIYILYIFSIYFIFRQFDVVVDLGCGRGHLSKNIYADMVKTLYQVEFSEKILQQAEKSPEVRTYKVIADEEHFPFKDSSIDLVISSLSLHWVNDLPGCFRQVHSALKNDGVFLGCLFGGDTLFELRSSLQLAELEREGGFAPHISPYTMAQDIGNLLHRTGYNMITLDTDEMVITYPTIFELMSDLQGMGENCCSWTRKLSLHRDSMLAAAAIYKEMYGNDEGIPATYQIIYFIGWKPDPSQPKPAARGSGEFSLKDLGRLEEITKEIRTIRYDDPDGKPRPDDQDNPDDKNKE